MRVASIQVGAVGELSYRGRTVRTAIVKRPVAHACRVSKQGLAGDEQADQVHHGGPDKAVCAYPGEHYPYWARFLGADLPPAAFGENLTLAGLTETGACIGDVYAAGSARLQISQPRRPCYKLAARYGVPRLALWVQASGRTGFYFRVIQAGTVRAGAPLELIDRPHPRLTVAEANRVMHRDRHDRRAIAALLVPELSDSWSGALARRLGGGDAGDDRARLG